MLVKRRPVPNYLNLNLGYLAVSIPCDGLKYTATRTPKFLPVFLLFLMFPSCQIRLESRPLWSSTFIHCPSRSLPGRVFLMPIGWNLMMWVTRSWCSCWSSIKHVPLQILTEPALRIGRFKQKTPFRIIISPILILKQKSSNRIICSVLVAKYANMSMVWWPSTQPWSEHHALLAHGFPRSLWPKEGVCRCCCLSLRTLKRLRRL